MGSRPTPVGAAPFRAYVLGACFWASLACDPLGGDSCSYKARTAGRG